MTIAQNCDIIVDEGPRRISVRGAEAAYRIVELASGEYAVSIDLAYHCGDHRGQARPLRRFDERQDCVEHFLEHANRFYTQELSGSCYPESQRLAQSLMLFALEGSQLFGFLEPPPG